MPQDSCSINVASHAESGSAPMDEVICREPRCPVPIDVYRWYCRSVILATSEGTGEGFLYEGSAAQMLRGPCPSKVVLRVRAMGYLTKDVGSTSFVNLALPYSVALMLGSTTVP